MLLIIILDVLGSKSIWAAAVLTGGAGSFRGFHQTLHESIKCFRSHECRNRGFESHSRHGCLCAFILCFCCPV
jgi:hypothetical protein